MREERLGGPPLRAGAPGRRRQSRALVRGLALPRWAEVALLGIVFVTATVGFSDRLPELSLGITLQVPDLLLVGSLALILVHRLTVPDFRFVRTPLDLPLLAFFGVTLFSTCLAVARSSVPFDYAIAAVRVFSYYLTFFVVTNLVRERRQIDFLVNGIFLLATIVALGMIGQYLLGGSVQLIPSSFGGLDSSDTSFDSARRIAPPGLSIVLVSLVAGLCILVVERFKAMGFLRCLQCGVLGVAFMVTFLRSYWAGLFAIVLLLPLLLRGAPRRRLLGWGLGGLAVATACLLVMYASSADAADSKVSRLLQASWERYSTLGKGGTFEGKDDNVEFRRLEYGYAWPAVASSPVIGLGMGAAYRPLDPRLDADYAGDFHDHSRLIHNGHMMVLLQSGLLGYLCLIWLSLAFVLRGIMNWRTVPDQRMRGVVLGFTLVYVAAFVAALGNSLFMLPFWTPVIGIIMGTNEVLLRKARLGEDLA